MEPTETNQPPSPNFCAARHPRIPIIVKDGVSSVVLRKFPLSWLPACGATLQQTIDLETPQHSAGRESQLQFNHLASNALDTSHRSVKYPRRHIECYQQYYHSHGRRTALASIPAERHRQSIARTIRAATLSKTILLAATSL